MVMIASFMGGLPPQDAAAAPDPTADRIIFKNVYTSLFAQARN